MADVFVDMSLATGLNDGTTWANAFQSFSSVSTSAGDDVWVKGTESIAGSITLSFSTSDVNNPVRIHGCLSATTNEPPVQADLIPGWRTGDARTVANRAYQDADVPTLTVTGGGNDLTIRGFIYMYGLKFIIADNVLNGLGNDHQVFEEVAFDVGNGEVGIYLVGSTLGNDLIEFINCELEWSTDNGTLTVNRIGRVIMRGVITKHTNAPSVFNPRSGTIIAEGCDFSDQAYTFFGSGGLTSDAVGILKNCKLNASSALFSGTLVAPGRVENHISDSTTGKSSGSLQNTEIVTNAGSIVDETTAVRTGGASDGEAGGHSSAFTPNAGDTQDQYHSLIGPWMAFWVTNSDTTVDVFIANSGAADYNDDDAWLEVMDVSNGGTAQHTHFTTQMDLLATPAAITDDTGSTWGSGGNNHQKLSATISPDFSGWAYCRVHFAKNFVASPETLYVDPNPVTS